MRVLASLREWSGVVALFLVIAGGTAYAVNTIGSEDIINGQVKSPDIGNNQVRNVDVRNDSLPGGGLTTDDIYSLTGDDIGNETLSGADIEDQSGVDTCTISARVDQLCFRAENFTRDWDEAIQHCGNIGMRAPTLGEALELVRTHDLPDVNEAEFFWTQDAIILPGTGGGPYAYAANDQGNYGTSQQFQHHETVCVTTPTN